MHFESNSAYLAYDMAAADLRIGNSGPIPRTLQNKHFDGEDNNNKGQFYNYPHDYPDHWVNQQYLPDDLAGVQYYTYGQNKIEQAAKQYWYSVKNSD